MLTEVIMSCRVKDECDRVYVMLTVTGERGNNARGREDGRGEAHE